jgi:MarR family transcriptional regulator, organic hydroperoxide resistance regulator
VTTTARPDEPNVLRIWFRFLRLHQRISIRAAQEFRTLGLSIPQFDLLSTLSEQEGVSQQELAARLYVTKGNVSGLVDRLASAGLVERRSLPADRRLHALYLTAKGRALTQRGLALQQQLIQATLGQLPPDDAAELDRLLSRWRDIVRDLPITSKAPKA